MKLLKSQNYYEILGVSRYATPEEIRKAYELSKQTYREDSLATYSLFSDEENQEILAQIARAYETLYNPELRREYDQFLAGLEGEDKRADEERVVARYMSSNQTSAVGGGSDPSREPPRAEPAAPRRPAEPQAHAPAAAEEATASSEDGRLEEFIKAVTHYDGAVLRKVRNMMGVTLEELAERTKIRRTSIEYLEEENFDFLPAAIYTKGFVTIIAKALGLPAQKVADDYMHQYRAKQQGVQVAQR